MFPTYKIVLRPYVNSEGRRTVFLRVTFKGKSKFFSLNLHCFLAEWNEGVSRFKKPYPFLKEDNELLSMYEERARQAIRELEQSKKAFTFEKFKESVFGADVTSGSLLDEIALVAKQSATVGTADYYKDLARVVKNFKPKTDLADIDVSWLESFERYMRKREMKDTSMSAYMRALRSVCNKAIKRKAITRDWYPFTNYSIAHFSKDTAKRAISIEEIRMLESAKVPAYWHFARDLFLFSFYNQGMNFKDIALLTEKHINAGRIEFQRSKTDRRYSIQLNEISLAIMAKYKGQSPYCFPILLDMDSTPEQVQFRLKNVRRRVNKQLREVAKIAGVDVHLLSFYSGRHSYATILYHKGASVSQVQAALGHKSERTTATYLKSFDNSVLDELNKKLLE